MIDYEKLKLAHELADKLTEHQAGTHFNAGIIPESCTEREFYIINSMSDYSNPLYYKSIDEFIEKLKELTQPKPKYEVGQKVFAVFPNYPVSLISELKITEININDPDVIYRTDGGGIAEAYVYPTREALIDAQIAYWESLKH